MDRRITGYHQDELGDWVAELDCGHQQHVRHQPPWFERPWVLTAVTREQKLGSVLACRRCDALQIPEHMQSYRTTRLFTEQTVPAGLLKAHTTKIGVWGKIHVNKGSLLYQITEPLLPGVMLSPENPGVIPAAIPHKVDVSPGSVEFYVEFFK